jgi:hypothetical protein
MRAPSAARSPTLRPPSSLAQPSRSRAAGLLAAPNRTAKVSLPSRCPPAPTPSARIPKALSPSPSRQLTVSAGQVTPLDISLQIAAEAQEVQVSDQAAGQVSVDPSSNVGALVLKNEDLDALPDDPDDLQADLEALAGPAAGPNGAQFFVDGFSGGQLPPKSSIREIRINSNPFSSEFDSPGFGRIEILTKPGTDSYHGSFSTTYGDRVLDTRNPFIGTEPGYSTKSFMGNGGGPINKKSSFSINFNRRQIDEDNLIKAQVLDSSLQRSSLTSARFPRRIASGARPAALDYADQRHQYAGAALHPHRFFERRRRRAAWPAHSANQFGRQDQQVQITETIDHRHQSRRRDAFPVQDPPLERARQSAAPGPASTFRARSIPAARPSSSPELYFQHRLRALEYSSPSPRGRTPSRSAPAPGRPTSPSFSTSQLQRQLYVQPQHAERLRPACLAVNAIPIRLRSISTGRRSCCFPGYAHLDDRSAGLRPHPVHAQRRPIPIILNVRQFDLGVFVQDDWRCRPNLTVSTRPALRNPEQYSRSQRLGARAGHRLGSRRRRRTRLRQDRDPRRLGHVLRSLRSKATPAGAALQRSHAGELSAHASPTLLLSSYPNLPPLSSLLSSGGLQQQNIYRMDPVGAVAPILMQSAVGVERALPGRSTLSFNFVNSRGDPRAAHSATSTRPCRASMPRARPYCLTPVSAPSISYETSGILQTDSDHHQREHALQSPLQLYEGLLRARLRAQQRAGPADGSVRHQPRLGPRLSST